MSTYKQPNAEHNQDIKISVITVCKNSEAHIEKAIQSVINQTYKNIEYIIVDGDSQDKTKEIIQNYSKYIAKFVSEPDTGIYNAMNKGIKLATGSFIQFLNSDDYFYDKNVIEDVVQFIQQNSDCDIVYGDVEIRPDPKISQESHIAKSPNPENIPDSVIYGHIFLQGSVFFQSTVFSKLGYFTTVYKISGDYEFYTRLLGNNTLKIFYYPRVIFSYSHGGISSDYTVTLKEMFKIQNQVSFFQCEYWHERRIIKFQDSVIEIYTLWRKAQLISEQRRILLEKIKNPMFWPELLLTRVYKMINKACLKLTSQARQ